MHSSLVQLAISTALSLAPQVSAWVATHARGELRVTGREGSEVLVDGVRLGAIDASGELALEPLIGEREVELRLFGYEPISESISIEPGSSAELEVDDFDLVPVTWIGAESELAPELAAGTWRLVLRTFPEDCRVDCFDLDWEGLEKSEARWSARGVHRGEFSLSLEAGRDRAHVEFTPRLGETVFLSVYLASGRVERDTGDLRTELPAGASLSIDGRPVAPQGGLLLDLSPGEHELVVSRPDHHALTSSVSVVPGEEVRFVCPPLRPRIVIVAGDGPAPELREGQGALVVRVRRRGVQLECPELGLEGFGLPQQCGFYAVPAGRYSLRFWRGKEELVHTLEVEPGRRSRLAVDMGAGEVVILPPSVEDLASIAELEGSNGYTASLAVDSGATRLAAATLRSQDIQLWDLETMAALDAIATTAEVRAVHFSADDRQLIALHKMQSVSVHDVRYGHRVLQFETGGDFNQASRPQPGSERLWTVAHRRLESVVALTDLVTGERVGSFVFDDLARGLAVAPDGGSLVLTCDDGLRVYDLADIAQPRLAHSQPGYAKDVCFSPDGTRLAGSTGRAVRVWNTAGWQELAGYERELQVGSLCWSPDGRYVAVTGNGVDLWDSERGALAKHLETGTFSTTCAVFAADGAALVVGTSYGQPEVWGLR